MQHLQLSITILDYDIDFGPIIETIQILEVNTSNQCLDYVNALDEHLALKDDFIILAIIPLCDVTRTEAMGLGQGELLDTMKLSALYEKFGWQTRTSI